MTYLPWNSEEDMPQVIAVIGSQWGDEGKGKLVDMLARNVHICARFNGGANAGHTLVVSGESYFLHLLPCGILCHDTLNLIGNGVVVHLKTLINEIYELQNRISDYTLHRRLLISNRAHLLFDIHQIVDEIQEKEKSKTGSQLGTTKCGIGPCYASKASRSGLRVGDLLHMHQFETDYRNLIKEYNEIYKCNYDFEDELARHREYALFLKDQIVDSVIFLNDSLKCGKRILVEGANAGMLDIDFGSYPYVTSSSTIAGGICTGLGLPPKQLNCFIGVFKSYLTRVGSGPFPTELFDDVGKYLQTRGHEYGTTTGRIRRCGWLDLQILRYSVAINGFNFMNLTKLDVLSGLDEIKLCIAYRRKSNGEKCHPTYFPSSIVDFADLEPVYLSMKGWNEDLHNCKVFNDLPMNAVHYVKVIESEINIPIIWIGVGPDRMHTITR